jgi:hypothetical protein
VQQGEIGATVLAQRAHGALDLVERGHARRQHDGLPVRATAASISVHGTWYDANLKKSTSGASRSTAER